MYSFTSDSKFLIITDTDNGEVWRLEKNQVSLKHINELVIIDRNGMHYKNVVYTQIVGNFASSALAVAYIETLVNTGQTVSIDTTGLATEAKQDTGNTSLGNIDTNLGAKADASATTDTGTFSLISLFKRLLEKTTTLISTLTDGTQKTKITDGAGTVTTKQLGTQVTNSDVGLVTNSLIHGLSSSGGGTFIDVKVNPAGKLEVNDADTQTKLTTTNNYLAALNALVPSVYDYVNISYTGSNATTVVYKSGGSGGTTVSTLTLAYDGSDNLTSVTKT